MKKLTLLIFTLFFLVGCSSHHIASTPNEPANTDAKLVISGILPEYSEDSMLSNSSIIAIGKIIDKSDAFGVVPVGGGTQYNFTDYTFEIADQLKGAQKSDVIIRVLGGTVNNFTVESEYAPDFVIGEQYLLFLSKVDVGGGYNTAGDYYTVFGSNQGVFTHDKDDDYFNSFYDKSYNCGSLKNTLSSTPSYANAFSSRAEFIQNQKRNLENGFISQAEYDAAIASLDVYAEIVK